MIFSLPDFESKVSQAIDVELESYVESALSNSQSDLHEIFRYHLGLETGSGKKGKRVRPVLTALCTAGAGADWEKSIPAACAIELIHNFSLIHDDIEDNGATRRGKPAVWKKWGLAKGINAGDSMFAAAFDLLGQNSVVDDKQTLDCINLISQTCLFLTEGQQLDIDYEHRDEIAPDEYFRMIEGKTAALIACCAQTGSLIAGLHGDEQKKYQSFGKHLGIAFQVQDDWLGVWGDPQITGKSASSDLLEKKKSYPVVLGFQSSRRFTEKWLTGSVRQNDINKLVEYLEDDGIKRKVEQDFHFWTEKALDDLESMECEAEVKAKLKDYTNKLLTRNQ